MGFGRWVLGDGRWGLRVSRVRWEEASDVRGAVQSAPLLIVLSSYPGEGDGPKEDPAVSPAIQEAPSALGHLKS